MLIYVLAAIAAIVLSPALVFRPWNAAARWRRRRSASVGLPLAAILLLGCNSGNADADNSETISVLCSTSAMYDGQVVTFAVQSFPGMSADDILTNVWVVESRGPQTPPDLTTNGVDYSPALLAPIYTYVTRLPDGSTYGGALAADGSVAIVCSAGQTLVTLFVRCEKEVCP